MSKPEHTESPAAQPDSAKSSAGRVPSGTGSPAESPAATPGKEKSAAGTAPSPVAKPADADAAAAAKPEPRRAAEPDAEARAADATADAEPAGSPAAKPATGKTAGASSGKPADTKPGPGEAADAKAADAKSGLGEPADAKPGDVQSGPGKPADVQSGLSEPADAKPDDVKVDAEVASVESGSGRAAAPAAKPAAKANPVVEKADAMAAAVKAAAAKAAEGGQDEGRLLAGRYRLSAVLGKGGMGTVWRAQDETLGRTVAVKELRFSTGVDEDEKRRLITRTLREAKAIARIRSGGAVTVYDVVDEDGRPWIVMELIEGPSLAEFIRENGPLTPHRAAEVGLAVLDVLRAAHGQGILHRDVKPSNVLIAGNGRVVLTDFGIAQVEGDPSVTSTGMLVGAPSYISPERARGHKPGPPADMWSLGGLLYASVEGVPPYDKGSALATLTAVMTEPVEPPKNAGPLTEVIYGLLAKDPIHRLDDARARAMLGAVLAAPEPVPAPVVTPAAEETRQISLADAKEAVEKAAADKAEKAAERAAKKERERREREQRERARAALKAARKAATAAAATTAVTAAEPPTSKPSPVKAPLTDVMQRRTIVLAAVALVVVLAVVGSLIAYALGDDDTKTKDESKGGNGKPTPAASAPKDPGNGSGGTGQTSPKPSENTGEAAGGGSAGTGTATGGQPGQGQQTPAASQGQGATSGGAGGAVPAGFALVQDFGFHFSMAMPEGFKKTATAGENSGGIYSRDGGFPRIQVDYTGKPGDDARLAWLKAVPGVASDSKGYRQIRIDVVDYRGYPTVADWEFEREQKGIRVRVLNRGFKLDATHGYAIMISCAADQWDAPECTQMRNVAFETFQPLG
ncbi:serine/threonine protein kinase [Streptomyces sp. CG 926]|uniref:serine/threonine protein kinase n=1 Tax=Streptomyces sp. CG 926 TaxID=1882405 RepID=UPI000D7A72E6|nr:serine/threonine protein kinase [Streptomyces sp. CG 926]